MSKKSADIADRIREFQGGELDPHYAGYFDCFNRQQFYEAHDVLEELWLEDRHGPDGDFYKGLIQLAGAFVHVQKKRPQPAVSLLNLAEANFAKYPPHHHCLSILVVLALIADWRVRIRESDDVTSLLNSPPRLATIGAVREEPRAGVGE